MLVRNDLEHRLLEFLGELIDPAAREQCVLALAPMNMEKREVSDRPDVGKMLVHACSQLSVCVISATCCFGELAQPVSLNPLEVTPRLCNVERWLQRSLI